MGLIIEKAYIDKSMEVRVVDEETGFEVCFCAPANTPRAQVEQIAINKMDYATKRQKVTHRPRSTSQGGIIV